MVVVGIEHEGNGWKITIGSLIYCWVGVVAYASWRGREFYQRVGRIRKWGAHAA